MDFELSDAQRELVSWASGFADKMTLEEDSDDPAAYWDASARLAESGLLALAIPTSFGGGGLPYLDALLAVEAIAATSPFLANVVRNTVAGPVAFVAEFGSEEQKQRLLPRVARGKELVAVCMTEAGAGSNSAEMRGRAVLGPDGHYTINASKLFITNADKATTFVVYVRFVNGTTETGIGAFLIDASAPGLTVGPPTEWMGGKVYEVEFQDVRATATDVLVPGEGGKDSYRILMGAYNIERLGGLFELLGIAQLALDKAVTYTMGRHQFGHPISEYQAVQLRLAEMSVELQAARLLTYRATGLIDAGRNDRGAVSAARIATTTMVQRVTDNAIQLHGGYGLTREYGLERLYRKTRHHSIAGGTIDMHRLIVARSLLQAASSS